MFSGHSDAVHLWNYCHGDNVHTRLTGAHARQTPSMQVGGWHRCSSSEEQLAIDGYQERKSQFSLRLVFTRLIIHTLMNTLVINIEHNRL